MTASPAPGLPLPGDWAERFELGDSWRVQLAIGIYSAVSRAVAAVVCWLAGLPWLALINGLGVLVYFLLLVICRRPRRLNLFIGAYGLEWVVWSIIHVVAFGFACSFQLYPLLLLQGFILLFHHLEPRTQLTLLAMPLIIFAPLAWTFGSVAPLVQLSTDRQLALSLFNDLVIATSVVVVYMAALLEHARARRAAERREVAEAQLVEDLSHELRTPLATLLILAQGARGQRAEQVGEWLGWIEESSRDAGRLVERLLELAALDHGAGEAGPSTPLAEVARRTAERAGLAATERGITIDFVVDGAGNREVDAASLEVVLRNLLNNAIGHSPDGSRIEVRVMSTEEGERIEVEDRGEGIASEHQALIFDRLWRADPARSRNQSRFGLGLPIAKRHAELLGARLEVRSELGRGSIFTLLFEIDSQA